MVLDTQFSLTGDWEAQICELWQQQVSLKLHNCYSKSQYPLQPTNASSKFK
jgi:hypothetical protein